MNKEREEARKKITALILDMSEYEPISGIKESLLFALRDMNKIELIEEVTSDVDKT